MICSALASSRSINLETVDLAKHNVAEGRPEHPALVWLGQLDSSRFVFGGELGTVFCFAGVDQPDSQISGFEQIVERPPALRVSLKHDPFDALLRQLSASSLLRDHHRSEPRGLKPRSLGR